MILFSFAALLRKVFIGQWSVCVRGRHVEIILSKNDRSNFDLRNNRERISYVHAHLCYSTHGMHMCMCIMLFLASRSECVCVVLSLINLHACMGGLL